MLAYLGASASLAGQYFAGRPGGGTPALYGSGGPERDRPGRSNADQSRRLEKFKRTHQCRSCCDRGRSRSYPQTEFDERR
jgi:hypothetical protein